MIGVDGHEIPFELRRLGVVMEPEPGNAQEIEGVLNSAAARGPDGQLYLFPRLVARGNYSRIGLARVRFDAAGDPVGVERLGVALEPEAEYERDGCEDPRITPVAPLGTYVMTYTAVSADGPRIAMAVSRDLVQWERLGLVRFARQGDIDFGDIANKDALLFPAPVADPAGRPALALMHRPAFPGGEPHDPGDGTAPREADPHPESLWLSYAPLDVGVADRRAVGVFRHHRRLAAPVAPWERVKVGGGTPPLLTPDGWLLLYHGVGGSAVPPSRLRYAAGALVLDRHDPARIRYRSPQPILEPVVPEEIDGGRAQVVFPTALDRRSDLGQPARIDVYYGMADIRIGVARLRLPDALPAAALVRPPDLPASRG